MAMLPKSKPQANQSSIVFLAAKEFRKSTNDAIPPVFVVGVRGYYFDTMGKPGANDRGIYDDAIFVISPDAFASFNANTDPGAFRSGIATLLPGVHWYRPGNHGISKPGGGYPAFRPATKGEALPVKRDGEDSIPSKRPGIAINIHRGAYSSVSSEGCQTIPPAQWDAFHALLSMLLKKYKQTRFPYILIEGPLK